MSFTENVNIKKRSANSISDKKINDHTEMTNDNDYCDNIYSTLNKLFEKYCQQGDVTNLKYMKSQRFFKFLFDSDIFDHKVSKVRAELIFTSESKQKKNINFNQFLQILLKISEVKYSEASNLCQQEMLKLLLKQNILPLYDRLFLIQSESNKFTKTITFKKQNNEINNEFDLDSESEVLFTFISHILYDIYKTYFPLELSLSENDDYIKEESQKGFLDLVKDYELSPQLVNKSTAFSLFRLELTNEFEVKEFYINIIKNLNVSRLNKEKIKNFFGKFFNFFKFLRVIGRIANISYDDVEKTVSRKLSLFGKFNFYIEKICLTLEKMETSDGFTFLSTKKSSSTHNLKTSIIIPKEILDKVKSSIFEHKNVNIK